MTTVFDLHELGDMGVRVLDCEHKTPQPSDQGYPYIAIPDIQQGRVVLDTARLISETDLLTWTRRTVPLAGDVIVTRRGRVGDTAPIPHGIRCAIGQNLVLLRSDGARIDQGYLRWAARSPQWWSEVDRLMNVGAIFSSLNVKDISRIKLPVPGIDEQRAIAEVLGALDDKIAANTKLAETSAHLAASVFIEAVGNERVSSQLKLVAQNVPGKYLPKDEYVEDGEYFVYGSNSVMGKYDRALCAGNFTVLAKIGSYCGNLRWSQRPAWVNNNASAIVPLEGVNPWILRHALENLDMGPHRAGTGQPYIRMESLFSAEVDLPSPACSERISPSLENLAETEAVAIEENRTLAATRDALLPQLMSGKLRVKDIENTMGEMV